ncbi:MAG: MCE family protein [Betaproteobacteria bacterium]|nr:MCE family protein [Betaproteobacteria bacterium]
MTTTPKEREQTRDRLIFLGSGLLLLIMVLLGFAKAQRWGTAFVTVKLTARDVSGLNRGEDIRIAGIPVGKVGGLHLNDQGQVDVQLQIETRKAHLIGPRSKARLAQDGLIGEPYLVISADPRPEEQAAAINGSTIPFQEPISVDSLLKQLSSTQKELQATLRNTTALTASNGSLKATLDATQQLAQTMNTQVKATAPVVREAMGSVAADVHAVSESTEAVEEETLSLIRETRPLVEQTIKDADLLTRSSQQVIDLLHNVLGPWLEPADGRKTDPR